MDHNLFIPSKLKVGFVKDNSTFTGKLAYVIYYDEKGKIRKEASWENWRDKKIEALELDNTPMLGYMLNRGVERYGYHGSGRSMIRVHDPRDFEFEISIDNLVGILMNNDVSKRDIQGECIFAWAGPELILLPTNSEEYKSSQRYTEKQSLKVSTKDLIKGATYVKKKDIEKTEYRYLGYFEWFDYTENTSLRQTVKKGKKHLFYTQEKRRNNSYQLTDEYHTVIAPMNTSLLSECVSSDIDENYPIVRKQFEDSVHSAEFTDFREELITADDLKKSTDRYNYSSSKSFCLKFGEDVMYQLDFSMYYHNKNYFENTYEYYFAVYPMTKDGNNYKNKMVKENYEKEKYLTESRYIYKLFGNKRQLSPEEFATALNENGFRKIIRTRSDGVTDTLYTG